MTDTSSFDLLTGRKEGWTAEAVLVVSPYVEEEFFTRLAKDLKPKRLHVVIDDGCRREDRDTVVRGLQVGGYKGPLAFKLGSARGLVHLKLYYVRWRTKGDRTAHSLVFGSANASRQGFSGKDNAELVADATLTASAHSDIIAWCEAVMAATREPSEVRVNAAHGAEMSKGLRLRLPGLTVGRNVSGVGNFDVWVQKGWLLSPYRPDPSFLRIVLPLARALPPGEQASRAAASGFDVAQTKSVRHNYVLDGEEEAEDEGEGDQTSDLGNWRRKVFTWTQLGEWCSDACEADHRPAFKRRHHEQRAAALEDLERLRSRKPRRALEQTFVEKVETLWTAFEDDAVGLLRGTADGGLDKAYYASLFNERVDRDLSYIADEEFRDRYVSGFEIVQVPRFRSDVSGWRAFLASLCRQLVLDDQRERNQSRLLTSIRDAIDAVGAEADLLSDPDRTLAFLRDLFERQDKAGRRAADRIRTYHHG